MAPGTIILRLALVALAVLVIAAQASYLYTGSRGAPDVDPPVGFTGDVSQPPAAGIWLASGTYTENRGYGRRSAGERIARRWLTEKRCGPGGCSFVLTREMESLPPQSAALVLRADGWHATFPKIVLGCQPGETWEQQTAFVLRFARGGRTLAAREVHHSYGAGCGYGVARVDWTARLVSGAGGESQREPERGCEAVRACA